MKKINKKDLITLEEYSPDKLNEVLTLAIKIKKNPKLFSKKLWGKTLGMIFHKTSTRTRISFEVGMYELGGFALHLNAGDMQMGKISSGDDSAPKKRPESFEDTAKTLSCYLDAIMMRTYSHSIVEEIAKTATIPVINGLTDTHHPCQIVADLMTMKEVYGKLKGLNLVYIGDGNNIVHSLLLGSALCGLNFKVICPINYSPNQRIVVRALEIAKKTRAKIQISHDLNHACKGADVVYTDVWASMGQEKEIELRKKAFNGYKITLEMMKESPDAVFMHCLPANRGEEVDGDVMDSDHSVIWTQAENRLHAQKAILIDLLK